MSVLSLLEQKIGVPPGSYPTNAARVDLEAWLVAQGLPRFGQHSISKASDYTIKQAYAKPSYLRGWLKNASLVSTPTLVSNPQLSELDELEDDPEYIPEPESPSPSTPIPTPSIIATADQIAAAAESVLTHKLDDFKRTVHAMVEAAVESDARKFYGEEIRALDERIHNSKLELSDVSKAQLRQIGLQAAIEAIAERVKKPPPDLVVLNQAGVELGKLDGYQHPQFRTLLTALNCGLHVMVQGGASSGKTTAAVQIAKLLGREFYLMGAVASEHKFAGYEDGNGTYHTTPFREAFQNGGLLLLDEYDRSIPGATMFANAALANNMCAFPDGMVYANPQFLCIAATNTPGRGQDRTYTAANQQDGAAMDRFVVLNWEIDPDLESQLYGDGVPSYSSTLKPTSKQTLSAGDWVRRVQVIRRTIQELGERHLVTMRASDYGSRLLKAGLSLPQVDDMCIWKGLGQAQVEKIKHHAQL